MNILIINNNYVESLEKTYDDLKKSGYPYEYAGQEEAKCAITILRRLAESRAAAAVTKYLSVSVIVIGV